MALDIYIEDKKVLLAYYPEQIGPDNYLKLLKEKGSRRLYNTFSVSETNFSLTEKDIGNSRRRGRRTKRRPFSNTLDLRALPSILYPTHP